MELLWLMEKQNNCLLICKNKNNFIKKLKFCFIKLKNFQGEHNKWA